MNDEKEKVPADQTETGAEAVVEAKPVHKRRMLKIELGILLGLVIIYIGMGIFFQSHFCFGTTINGIRVDGKSVAQVEKMLADEIHAYSLELLERENGQETISGESIDLHIVLNGEVQQFLDEQNGFLWGIQAFAPQHFSLDAGLEYDADALSQVIDQLEIAKPSNQREPVNAECSEYRSGKYELVPADYGTTLDKKKLMEALDEAILSLAQNLDLDAEGCYKEPEVGDDNEKLLALIDQMNCYVSTKITYDFENEKEVLDGDTIAEWLSVGENLTPVVDEEQVLAYVKKLAGEYNTVYKTKKLMTSYGVEVSISPSPYGWKIDNSGEVEQILADLKEGTEIEREPVYLQRANSRGENDYGNSYVEINLTAQHLFVYKDGNLVVESDLVSGCVAKGNATPSGAYALTYKTRDAVLRGATYATPVSYWMPFNGNIGMHDLKSRKAFGGDIYKTKGSHGCINLPLSAAKTIYETVSQGYPVFVYELPGTESDAVKQQEVDTIINEINSIGPVTLYSEPVILDARNRYNALDDATKQRVTNYQILLDSEAALAQLKAEAEAVQTETAPAPEEVPAQ